MVKRSASQAVFRRSTDAKAQFRRWIIAVLAASVPAIAAAQEAPQPPAPRWCLPFAMMRETYEGDLDRALAHSEECTAAHMNWIPADGGTRWDPADPNFWPHLMSGPWALAFQCATAQLHAMSGSISQAERALNRAEQLEASFAGFRTAGWLTDQTWRQVLMAATRGFILERRGKLSESAAAYRKADEMGASRLAVLALTEKDDSNASAWTRIAGDSASALAVAGALAELRHDDASTFLMYYYSDEVMRRSFGERPTMALLPPEMSTGSQASGPAPSMLSFQPMLLAERSRVRKGLERFGDRKAPPPMITSAIVRNQQEAFNKWLQNDARKVAGVAFRPQYPRFFIGFTPEDRDAIRRRKLPQPPNYDPSAFVYLPESIAVTGLLDRDTLAIDFYRLSAQLLSVATQAELTTALLLSKKQPEEFSPERLMALAELRSGLADLASLARVLQNLSLRTSSGQLHTASEEALLAAHQWKPDFSTARLDVLTEDFAKSFDASLSGIRDHVAKARAFLH